MPNTREKLIALLACAEDSLLEQAVEWDDEQKEEHIADGDGYGFYADYLIANGVTVQKWISVKDRLPERFVYVLAMTDFGEAAVARLKGNGRWYIGWDNGQYAGITHWMPLPQPPKGE